MHLALFQPDIAGNAGATVRLAAGLGLPLAIVEPSGFVWDRRRLRRVALDHLDRVALTRHPSFDAFEAWRRAKGRRLVLLSSRAAHAHHRVAYRDDDVLLAGRESAGVPPEVHAAADLAVRVPITPGTRSLNVVIALAIVAAEALRQTDRWPP